MLGLVQGALLQISKKTVLIISSCVNEQYLCVIESLHDVSKLRQEHHMLCISKDECII